MYMLTADGRLALWSFFGFMLIPRSLWCCFVLIPTEWLSYNEAFSHFLGSRLFPLSSYATNLHDDLLTIIRVWHRDRVYLLRLVFVLLRFVFASYLEIS